MRPISSLEIEGQGKLCRCGCSATNNGSVNVSLLNMVRGSTSDFVESVAMNIVGVSFASLEGSEGGSN